MWSRRPKGGKGTQAGRENSWRGDAGKDAVGEHQRVGVVCADNRDVGGRVGREGGEA